VTDDPEYPTGEDVLAIHADIYEKLARE